MFFKMTPDAKFPRKFQYNPLVKPLKPLIATEIRRPEPQAVLVVKPGEEFELSFAEFQTLFMKDTGPLYDPKLFQDLGEVKKAEEAPKKKA